MNSFTNHGAVALAMFILAFCSFGSYNFGKKQSINKHFSSIKKELHNELKEMNFEMKKELLEDMNHQIHRLCNQDTFISKMKKNVTNNEFENVKSVKSLQFRPEEIPHSQTKIHASAESSSTPLNMELTNSHVKALKSVDPLYAESSEHVSIHLQRMISRSLNNNSSDFSALCPNKEVLFFQSNFDNNNTNISWLLSGLTVDKIFQLQPTTTENDNFANTYFKCLREGISTFQIFNLGQNEATCGDFPICYRLLINDEIVANGTTVSDKNTHRIIISNTGHAKESQCKKFPLLSPVNLISNNGYDERIDKIMTIIHTITEHDEFNSFNTAQYKAACWLLFDDAMQLPPDDEFLFQRYTVAVLVFSTTLHPELFLNINTCGIAGISCDDRGHIRDIILPGRRLAGTIPSEISQLQFLEEIDVGHNRLIGTIPSEFGRLTYLRYLSLVHTSLEGKIPTEMGRLSNIESIDLGENNLHGNIPSELGQCIKLKGLSLKENNLTGSIPPEMFDSIDLEWLNLGKNLLIGTIPSTIQQVQGLKELFLHNNHLTGSIPSEMGALSLATRIELGKNQLTGTLPKEMGNLKSLTRLLFEKNKFTGTLPEAIGDINSLDVLWLNENSFTGTLPTSIYKMSQLQSIDISSNRFTGSISDAFWDLPFISVSTANLVLLDDNDLTGTVPDEFCAKDLFDFKIDNFPWYHNTKVDCACCGGTPECYIWNPDEALVFGTIRPPCPRHNIHNFEFYWMHWVTDETANATFLHNINLLDWSDGNVCLSPTGCFEIHLGTEQVSDNKVITEPFLFNYNASSMSLSKQEQCDAVTICGTLIDSSHPKRPMVNHITQIALSDMNLLNDQSSPSYQALCWMVANDTKWNKYEICDGTLLQRYVMALFYFSQEHAFQFQSFSHLYTCEWPGVECDSNGKYIQEINLSDRGLRGSIITEIGLLQSLKTIDFSSNKLIEIPFNDIGHLLDLKSLNLSKNQLRGVLDPMMFTSLSNLMTFDISNNRLGGDIPKEIFETIQMKDIIIANNLFVGTLPNEFVCAQNLDHVDLSNNLLQGTITDALFHCKQLKHIDLSQNGFDGPIPPSIGELHHVQTISLDQNRLSGSIPVELFRSSQIQILNLQSNQLTGKIPTQIGNLENAAIISMNGNLLKGTIPSQLFKVQQIKSLHLHHNQLTGTAPEITFIEETKDTFITDCGSPSILSGGAIDCKTCTMCCNSEGRCQERDILRLPIWLETIVVLISVPILFLLISRFVMLPVMQFILSRGFVSERDPETTYQGDSVYCFVLSKKKLPWIFYAITATIQIWLFATYLNASNVLNEDSDFRLNYRCPDNAMECDDESSVGRDGWALFFIVVFLYLGRDIALSMVQILSALEPPFVDIPLLVSGVGTLLLTALAMFTSFMYNFALAEKNTDLVTNAVILLFINDLDEHFLNMLMTLAPGWTENILEEIRKDMRSKRRRTTMYVNDFVQSRRALESATEVYLFGVEKARRKKKSKTNGSETQSGISSDVVLTTAEIPDSDVELDFVHYRQIEVLRHHKK